MNESGIEYTMYHTTMRHEFEINNVDNVAWPPRPVHMPIQSTQTIHTQKRTHTCTPTTAIQRSSTLITSTHILNNLPKKEP